MDPPARLPSSLSLYTSISPPGIVPLKGRFSSSGKDCSIWEITEEDVLLADAALDAPLDYEARLRKERLKNGVTNFPRGNFIADPNSEDSSTFSVDSQSNAFSEHFVWNKHVWRGEE
jgi:hypothetical protein